MKPPPRVWIAWETQRRSLNLSRRLGARLRLCLHEDRGLLRYPLSIAKTVPELWRARGGLVCVQNPSMILAALACFLKRPFGYALLVDRHSNFPHLRGGLPASRGGSGWRRRALSWLSAYSLSRSDLTLVTNADLLEAVEKEGGRGFILPDPLPETAVPQGEPVVSQGEPGPARRRAEILFVSSWADDEPIAETIEACRSLGGEAVVRITGRMKPAYARLLASAPGNFVPTGFLSDGDYFSLMARADAVMAVTKRPATLVCGAYEAIALGKPMILGDTAALREYFRAGAVHTRAAPSDLVAAIRALLADLPRYRGEVARLRSELGAEWDRRLESLEGRIAGVLRGATGPLTPGPRETCLRGSAIPRGMPWTLKRAISRSGSKPPRSW